MNQNQNAAELQLTDRHIRALINVCARNSRKKRDVKLANEARGIIVERFIQARMLQAAIHGESYAETNLTN
jgi:hypothetical protein